MKKILNASFWKKFFKYTSLGICTLILLVGLNRSTLIGVLADDEEEYGFYPTLSEEPSYTPYEEEEYGFYPPVDLPEPAAPVSQPPVYTPPTYSQPTPTYTQPTPRGGDFSFRYPECDWNSHQVYDVYQDSLGNYDRRNYHTQPGACGAAEAYSQPVSTPAQIPTCSEDVTYWDPNAGNNIRKHGGYYESYHPLSDSQGCVYAFDRVGQTVVSAPAPVQFQTQTQSIHAPITVTQGPPQHQGFIPPVPLNFPPPPFIPAPAPIFPQHPVIPQPIVPQQPVIIHQGSPAQPITNTNTNTNNNTNTATATLPPQVTTVQTQAVPEVRFATATSSQPRVIEVAGDIITKELPKTGLPLVAWGAVAFIPAGLRLRRFKKTHTDESANFIWEDRQFKI